MLNEVDNIVGRVVAESGLRLDSKWSVGKLGAGSNRRSVLFMGSAAAAKQNHYA
jgi:hypothetical protein